MRTDLGHDELLEVDVLRQSHAPSVDAKDAALGLGVWQRELNLAVYPAWPDECRVQGLYLVGRHDDLQPPLPNDIHLNTPESSPISDI